MLETKESNSWQVGLPARWILQALPEGGVDRIPSSNNTASPIPASLMAWVQKQYLSLLQASHAVSGTRDRDLGAFCPLFVSSAHVSNVYPVSTSPWSGSCHAKPRLELKNLPPSAVLKALWQQESPQLADMNAELVPFQDAESAGFWGIKRALINRANSVQQSNAVPNTAHKWRHCFKVGHLRKTHSIWHRIIRESAHHSFSTRV